MKKMLFMLLILAISIGASAQHRYSSYPRNYHRSRVVVGVGIGDPIYPYYGYGGYYDPFYSPYNRYPRESRLDLKIDDIKADYRDRIWSARHDRSLSSTERKRTVRELKTERDHAIHDAEVNYYKSRR